LITVISKVNGFFL